MPSVKKLGSVHSFLHEVEIHIEVRIQLRLNLSI